MGEYKICEKCYINYHTNEDVCDSCKGEDTKDRIIHVLKNEAVALFKQNGMSISENITFASKNKSANSYWANPNYSILEYDWYLILNDYHNRKLHLFFIKAGSGIEEVLVPRADMKDVVDLQIKYNDATFMDTRSGHTFKRYKIKELDY